MHRLNHCQTYELPHTFIRSMHLSRLPASVRPLLDVVGSEKSSDDDYSVLADESFKRQPKEHLMINGAWRYHVYLVTKHVDRRRIMNSVSSAYQTRRSNRITNEFPELISHNSPSITTTLPVYAIASNRLIPQFP